jgi:uncharacterized membrane protein YoaK (UPF0700 family)
MQADGLSNDGRNAKGEFATGILVLTACTAGLVDVISFARLGGIFTSAMTGNLALLGFYTATGAVHSAIRALSALCGFLTGCAVGMIQSHRKTKRSRVAGILGLETLIIMVCAFGSLLSPLSARSDFLLAQIILLGVAMGLQSIVGAWLKQTNIVFTTTLIRIVSAAIGSTHEKGGPTQVPREAGVVAGYLFGALIAGITIATHFAGALLIPTVAIGIAFISARRIE